MHADFFVFVTHFDESQVDKVFKNGFESLESRIPFNGTVRIDVFNKFGSALDPFRFGVRRSDFFDFFDKLEETVMEKIDFGLEQDVICELDQFIDFFVLFSKDGFLTVDIAFLMVFLVMISHIIDLDVVFEFELLDFLVDGDFKLLNNNVLDFLYFGHEMVLDVLFGVFLEHFGVFRLHGVGWHEVDWFLELIGDISDLEQATSGVFIWKKQTFIE